MDTPEPSVPAVPAGLGVTIQFRHLGKWITIAIAAIVVVGGVLLYLTNRLPSPFAHETPTVSSSPDVNAYLPYEPKATPPVSDVTPTPIPHRGEVVFQSPTPYTNLELFPPDTSAVGVSPSPLPQTYERIGTFTAGQYAGSDLVLATVTYEGPGGPTLFRFVVKNGLVTLLKQHSDSYWQDPSGASSPTFTTDPTYGIAELLFPAAFKSPDGTITFTRDQYVQGTWDDYTKDNTLVKAFTLQGYGDVFTDDMSVAPRTSPTGYGFRPGTNGFYLKAPDDTVRVYAMDIPFVPRSIVANSTPSLIWSDGSVNTQTYTWTDRGGCGSVNYASVIMPRDVADADLMIGGRTSTGDPVLVFKDANHPFLKNIYESEYPGEYGDGGIMRKVPYATFAAAHPVFFWRDHLGRLIKFLSTQFEVQAECGKPVIYLYPQETTRVSVQVAPRGGMTKSEPAYGDGWVVTAQPDGDLTDADGTSWPYLFWEGRGGIYTQPDRGWVISREQVSGFLDEKLSSLGLLSNEILDFKEFWLPRMQDAPYYFVTFLGNQAMNDIAPLQVVPSPDTIIRILMDFSPLTAPKHVQPFTIHTPRRTGFTVVEWGGVIR